MALKPMKPLTIRLSDEKLIARIERLAAKQGRSVTDVARELVEATIPVALGDQDLTPAEAAKALGVHKNTLLSWLHQGKFPRAYYVNQRVLRIPYKDVAALTKATVTPTFAR